MQAIPDWDPQPLRPLPCYEDCYVCGPTHPHGLHIRFFATPTSEIRARLEPAGWMCGYDDVVHGGVVTALLDELIGWAVSLRNDLLAITGDLTVRFVKPVLVGAAYAGRGRVGKGRGRLWEAEGELVSEDGTVHAMARGRYLLLSEQRTHAMASRMTYRPEDVPAFRSKHAAGGNLA